VAGDVLNEPSLESALSGVETAYYLVHSMAEPEHGHSFVDSDRLGARNFIQAADADRVRRIIYLGGLADEKEPLSKHLRSRLEVGHILASGSASVVEFRASVIIGAQSFSFEMVRALVDRLPIMVTPRWVRTPAQPIGIDDVISYLIDGMKVECSGHCIFEIGGPEQVSYEELMREYARQKGLKRLMIPVPVLTPALSSLWLALVTPLHAKMGRKLIDSIPYPMIVNDNVALRAFPIKPASIRDTIAAAIDASSRTDGK
jgi:uncharacterized protein YbjT (DUF2867 family)